MGTTPIYNFPYPEPTDLVRDGAQNFEDLADAVETTVDDLASIDVATAKGDLVGYDGTDYAALSVGTNGQVLVADSAQATGLNWGSADSMTLLASGNLTSTAVNVTGIPATFNELKVRAINVVASTTATLNLRMNGFTVDQYARVHIASNTPTVNVSSSQNSFAFLNSGTATGTTTVPATNFYATITSYKQPAAQGRVFCFFTGNSRQASFSTFFWSACNQGPLTSIQISLTVGTFTAGTFEVFGVK